MISTDEHVSTHVSSERERTGEHVNGEGCGSARERERSPRRDARTGADWVARVSGQTARITRTGAREQRGSLGMQSAHDHVCICAGERT